MEFFRDGKWKMDTAEARYSSSGKGSRMSKEQGFAKLQN